MNIGIDYGMGRTNIDHATGIRYGVIQANYVGQAWFDASEADYGTPTCPKCGNDVQSSDSPDDGANDDELEYENYSKHGCDDYICHTCQHFLDSSDVYGDEAIGHSFEDSDYTLTQGGDDSDIFVIKSPYYTRAQFCSPCAPGACYLTNPVEGGPKAYCLNHDWFEEGKAPYPVYRVSDDSLVTPDEAGK